MLRYSIDVNPVIEIYSGIRRIFLNHSIFDIGFHLLDPDSDLNELKSKSDAIQIPEEILERYVGEYELQPNFKINITKSGSQLYGQATGQDRFELFAENENKFYLNVVDAKISFQVEGDKVVSLTLFQAGKQLIGKRID